MSRKVYIVTSGQYSEYGIDAVFDGRALAHLYVDTRKWRQSDRPEIEEWDLNPDEAELRVGRLRYAVNIRRDGQANATPTEATSDEPPEPHFYKGVLVVICYATDEKHAIKIANERRAALIAAGQWPDSEG